MATKQFCDACGCELGDGDNAVSKRLATTSGAMNIEVLVGRNGTWNAGEYCRGCVLDAIAQLDTRSKEKF